MVSVSLAGYPQGIDNLVFAAGQELGGIFEYNLDQNDGNNLGLCEFKRMSSEEDTLINPIFFCSLEPSGD